MTKPQSAPWDAFKDPALTELEKQLIADLAAAKLDWEKLSNERDELRAKLATTEIQRDEAMAATEHHSGEMARLRNLVETLSAELEECKKDGQSSEAHELCDEIIAMSNETMVPAYFKRRADFKRVVRLANRFKEIYQCKKGVKEPTPTTQLPQDPALLNLASWLIEHARGVGEYGLGEEWLAKYAKWKERVGK